MNQGVTRRWMCVVRLACAVDLHGEAATESIESSEECVAWNGRAQVVVIARHGVMCAPVCMHLGVLMP
jgi:hypothetical protein